MRHRLSKRQCLSKSRSGLSLFEVLFLLAILAIATSLLLLRVSKGRSATRRIECESNLRSLSVAIDSYQLLYGHYPIGTQNPTSPIRSEAKGYHHNWIEGLLPQMEQQSLFETIDDRFGVYAPENQTVGETSIEILHCPSYGRTAAGLPAPPNRTDYAGVTASTESPISESGDGTFILNQIMRPSDLSDGLNHVAILGEKLHVSPAPLFQWNSGTRVSLRTLGHPINDTQTLGAKAMGAKTLDTQASSKHTTHRKESSQPNGTATTETSTETSAETFELHVGGFASRHPGGAYLLMASGEYRFCSEQTDRRILEQLGSRSRDTSSL